MKKGQIVNATNTAVGSKNRVRIGAWNGQCAVVTKVLKDGRFYARGIESLNKGRNFSVLFDAQ